MTSLWRKAKAGVLLVPFIALLAACNSPVSGGGHVRPAGAQLRDRATGDVIATTERVGNALVWSGSVSVEAGGFRELDVTFLDAAGAPIQLGAAYSLRTRLATADRDGVDGPRRIAGFADHEDHILLGGVSPGETFLVIMVWHGSHSDWESPPLRVVVPGPRRLREAVSP